ncbi:hypothetical protein QE377_001007 [Microbacterium sp. SORGH_AS 862]|nr:hypothetical protein [Microbacterium sp. SORGH_AS_0862]
MNTNSEPGASSKPRVTNSVSDRSTGRVAHDPSPPGTPAAESIDYGIDSHAFGMTPPESNGRVGKLRLDALRMSLSARDTRIIGTLKQHRFLSTNHVERWHFSDHASKLSAARTTRRVLARLKHLGVITALDRRLGGVQGGSTQHVWHLTPAGERLGADQPGRRVREPSTAFLHHELGIASVHVAFIEAERAGRLRLIDFTTEPRCWRQFPGVGGQVRNPETRFLRGGRCTPRLRVAVLRRV